MSGRNEQYVCDGCHGVFVGILDPWRAPWWRLELKTPASKYTVLRQFCPVCMKKAESDLMRVLDRYGFKKERA